MRCMAFAQPCHAAPLSCCDAEQIAEAHLLPKVYVIEESLKFNVLIGRIHWTEQRVRIRFGLHGFGSMGA